jgi:hypothetical protein
MEIRAECAVEQEVMRIMQISRLARAAAASFAVLVIAGQASAFTMEVEGDDGSKTLLMGVDAETNFLRGLLPGLTFTRTETELGDAWAVEGLTSGGTSYEGETLAQLTEQATYGPTYDATYSPSSGGTQVAAIPEPSAALLLALGMTVSGAHLRRQGRR